MFSEKIAESSLEYFVKSYVFNKSKKKTIIFIHGLFGTSGYWLTFLKYFKNFKILILDIDYPKIFIENPNKINLHKLLESMLEDYNEYILISHSMGTVLAQYFPEKKIKISYEICPIKNSVKNNKKKFLKEIDSVTNLSKKEIKNILEKATIFLSNSGIENKSLNKKQYFPKLDLFFNEPLISENKQLFEGSHFNITNSISMINKDLTIN